MLDQTDEYFNHPCRDFAKTDEALTVAKGQQRARSRTKALSSTSTPRPERRSSWTSMTWTRWHRSSFGWDSARWRRSPRRRKEYLLDGVTVSLDSIDGLGDFVELEVQGDDAEQGRKMIERTRDGLGLVGSERRSYLEMITDEERKNEGPGRFAPNGHSLFTSI